MPAGSPLTATDTDPENPFKPLTETVTGPTVVPTWALTEEVETEIEKSGVCVAGGGVAADPPPPQLVSNAADTRAAKMVNARALMVLVDRAPV